ncbi:MAG: hypothetical protein QM751_06175 [Paludibacteraceae bacterium]
MISITVKLKSSNRTVLQATVNDNINLDKFIRRSTRHIDEPYYVTIINLLASN